MPKEGSHVNFENYQKTLMFLFAIEADIAAIIKESDDD